jgi:hypothetical protein
MINYFFIKFGTNQKTKSDKLFFSVIRVLWVHSGIKEQPFETLTRHRVFCVIVYLSSSSQPSTTFNKFASDD